jgi:UDP-N-acetylmuramate dehydrogenase
MDIKKNFPLKSLNTFALDVKAAFYTEVHSPEELKEILSDKEAKTDKKMILGGGSNVLFTGNFPGLIIHNKITGIERLTSDENYEFIKTGAGVVWHDLVLQTIKYGLGGLENLSLIPGFTGAAPIQNIGAYGVEIKNTFYSLNAVNLESGETETFNAEECRFGYRDSIFKQEAKGKYAITDVTFRLNKKPVLNTTYGAIEQELNTMGISTPTIRDVSNAVIRIRQSKLPDPKVIGNAGSFFKNPEVAIEKYNSLKKEFREITAYPAAHNKMKLAAGWLIEQCGWKGKMVGQTGMHAKQALVLVNAGNATGKELIEHALRVQKSVYEKFGVELEMEVNIISSE